MISYLKNNKIQLLLLASCIVFYSTFAYNLNRSDFIKLILLFGALFVLTYKIIQSNQEKFWYLAGIGVLFRLIFIGSTPNLSQDFYRFIWDGRLVFQGLNPYLFSPESVLNNLSTALDKATKINVFQAQELFEGMGSLNGSHFSNYPPVNQLFFTIAALFAGKSILGSVIVMRISIILADIGILYFGRKPLTNLDQNPNKIFWYFLNPFIIIELTGNLHFEGVMIFFILCSIYFVINQKYHNSGWMIAGVFLSLAAQVKLIPLMFIPFFYKNLKWKKAIGFTAVVMLVFLIIGLYLWTDKIYVNQIFSLKIVDFHS